MHLQHLSNDALLASLKSLATGERRLLARIIAHLAEIEERRLHLDLASSSMFDFCTRRLGFSEGEAFRRIVAARLIRRFPRLLAAIEEGRLHLSTLVLLRDELTEANVDELVDATSGKSKREVQELIARRCPRPDVATSIRKLPEAKERGRASATSATSATSALLQRTLDPPPAMPSGLARVAPPATPPRPAREPVVPLSEGRYKLELTMSASLREKLEHARELLRHAHPGGDLAVVVERAVDLLIEKLEKAKLGKSDRPQRPREPAKVGGEQVARATRREVFARDGMQCAFVGADGERCPARSFLELDHVRPRARGGDGTTENLRVLCREHNRHLAEAAFGRAYVERRISERRRACGLRAPFIGATDAGDRGG